MKLLKKDSTTDVIDYIKTIPNNQKLLLLAPIKLKKMKVLMIDLNHYSIKDIQE